MQVHEDEGMQIIHLSWVPSANGAVPFGQCDGERPECGRCKGYGYTCIYRLQRPRQRTGPQRFSDELADQLPDLCDAMAQQETLLEHVLSMLPSGSKKKSALSKHSLVKSQLDQAVAGIKDEIIGRAATIGAESVGVSPSSPIDTSPGYLGEVSDICFVNLVKRFLQPQGGASITQADFESYDQGEGAVYSGAVASNVPPLPALEDVEQLINAYFSTIHVAYPFIPETRFKESYVQLRDKETTQNTQSSGKLNATETALTCRVSVLAGLLIMG